MSGLAMRWRGSSCRSPIRTSFTTARWALATAYLPNSANAEIADKLGAIDGIMMAMDRAEAVNVSSYL